MADEEPGTSRGPSSGGGSKSTLLDRYLRRIKNHPLPAAAVILALIVVGIAQFTTALKDIEAFVQDWMPHRSLPDLVICGVDPQLARIDICNLGDAPVNLDDFMVGWSQDWYAKPGWNSMTRVGSERYLHGVVLKPGLRIVLKDFGWADPFSGKSEFMVDAAQEVEESDELNNCADISGKSIPCRSR